MACPRPGSHYTYGEQKGRRLVLARLPRRHDHRIWEGRRLVLARRCHHRAAWRTGRGQAIAPPIFDHIPEDFADARFTLAHQLYVNRTKAGFLVDNYDRYQEAFFSRIVSQFLAQQCDIAPEKKIAGRVLFRRFRDYWNEVTHGAKHPALLGQLRVELTELGFASSGGKWPRWYGLSLRKKKQIQATGKKAKAPKTHQAQISTDSETYRAIPEKALVSGPVYC